MPQHGEYTKDIMKQENHNQTQVSIHSWFNDPNYSPLFNTHVLVHFKSLIIIS